MPCPPHRAAISDRAFYMEQLLTPYAASPLLPATNILVLAPHADDEIFGCGGALALHAKAGCQVHVIVITDGAARAGDPLAATVERETESLAAATTLGIPEPEFWRLPDRGLAYCESFVGRLMSVIRERAADLVYAPSLFEAHPDHRAVALSAVEAVRRIGEGVRLAMYEVGAPGRPNVLIDITPVLDGKRAAMRCFTSQLAIQRYDEQIEALNRYRTYTLPREVEAVEAFEVVDARAIAADALAVFTSEYQRQQRLGLPVTADRDMPLVSVIIRSTDRPTLAQALDSVTLQTYGNVEVVLVNALGSTHRAPPSRCGRFPLRWVDAGHALSRSAAANAGLDASVGQWLIFLDDDDWLDPDHVATLVAMVLRSRNARAAYCGVRTIEDGGTPGAFTFNYPFDPIRLLAGNFIPIHAVLFERSLVTANGCRFDEAFALYEDWDFWLQVAVHTNFLHVDAITANYRIAPGSGFGVAASQRAQEQGKQQCYRKWRNQLSDDYWYEILDRSFRYIGASEERDAVRGERDALRQEHDALHQQCAALENQNRTLATTLAEHAAALALREQEAEQLTAKTAHLGNELAASQSHAGELRTILAGRDTDIVALRTVIREFQGSASWRVTAPLRFASRLVRRLATAL